MASLSNSAVLQSGSDYTFVLNLSGFSLQSITNSDIYSALSQLNNASVVDVVINTNGNVVSQVATSIDVTINYNGYGDTVESLGALMASLVSSWDYTATFAGAASGDNPPYQPGPKSPTLSNSVTKWLEIGLGSLLVLVVLLAAFEREI